MKNLTRFRIDRFILKLDNYLPILKAIYPEGIEDMLSDYPQYKNTCIEEFFNEVEPIRLAELMNISNIELRQYLMTLLPLDIIFQQAEQVGEEKTILTSQINQDGSISQMENTYTLFKIDYSQFFSKEELKYRTIENRFQYAVKCIDSSTDRVFYIRVEKTDCPLEAIASTIRTRVPKNKIKGIYRQGDIFMFEIQKGTELLNQKRQLTKEEYFNLMKQQT